MRIKNAIFVLVSLGFIALFLTSTFLYWSGKRYIAYSALQNKEEELSNGKEKLIALNDQLEDAKDAVKNIERFIVDLNAIKKDILNIKKEVFSSNEYNIVDYNITSIDIDKQYMNLAHVNLKLQKKDIPLEIVGQGLCSVFNSIYKIAYKGQCKLNENQFSFVVRKE